MERIDIVIALSVSLYVIIFFAILISRTIFEKNLTEIDFNGRFDQYYKHKNGNIYGFNYDSQGGSYTKIKNWKEI